MLPMPALLSLLMTLSMWVWMRRLLADGQRAERREGVAVDGLAEAGRVGDRAGDLVCQVRVVSLVALPRAGAARPSTHPHRSQRAGHRPRRMPQMPHAGPST
jgi:hypothetical protein